MSVNKIYNIQEWQQVSIVATPSSNTSIIYPKTDGNWYSMNSDGIERIQSLSYNIGNGLTASTASGLYNYNLSVNIDNYGLTFANGVLKVGYLTSSVFSQLGPATASYILSVNSSGIPIWIPYSSQGINGTAGYIPKFNDVNSITNSNIYDGGTFISLFTASNSFNTPALFVNGAIDASSIYLNSNSFPNIEITARGGVNRFLDIYAPNFGILDPDNNVIYLSGTQSSVSGNTVNILNVVRVNATGSSNATSSVIIPFGLVGIGTASPTHKLHVFGTQPSFRYVDGSQGNGKYLTSDANGVASWQTPVFTGTVSLAISNNSGLTQSNFIYSILLANNSGLTLSTDGLSINPNSIGYGLSFSGGTLSVTGNFGINTGSGLTYSGNTYSVNLGINSGLTFSGTSVIIQIGSGLTLSNGSLASTGLVSNGVTNSFPYFNTSTSLTSSVIYQVSNNVLIGTSSNVGSKLYVAGSFSFTNDGIINSINIGRGLGNNILFGNRALSQATPGNYNIAIGDNALVSNQSTDNIAIGFSASNSISGAKQNIGIGNYVLSNSNSPNNVAIGYRAAFGVSDAGVYIGTYAGYAGGYNVVIGYNSGGNSSGSGNIIIGYNSGVNSSGSNNILLGYAAGVNFLGSYSVIIGGFDTTGAYASLNNSLNTLFISDGFGNLRIYSPSTGNILMGTTSETGSKLVVSGSASFYGNLKIVDSTQAAGRYLVSDSNGNTSWYMPVGLGMTISGYTFSVNLQTNSGLTVSMSGLAVNPNIAGYGLTYSGGSMSFTTNINASQGYIPYYNTVTSLTSSVIYQTSSNILVATTSNDGSRLQIAGSVSIYGKLKIIDGTQAANRLLVSDQYGIASWTSSTLLGSSFFAQGGNSFGATATLGTTDNRNMQVIAGGNNIILFATSSMTLNVPIVYSNANSGYSSLNNNGLIITNTTNGANGIGLNAASGGNPNLDFYINSVVKAGIGYTNIAPIGAKGLGITNLVASPYDAQLVLDEVGSLQWRDGSNGGSSIFRWSIDKNGAITQSVAQLLGSLSTSAYSITQTWNTSGTPTAIKMNITDTNSATASLFLDLQKSGVSQFNVDKNGNTIIGTASSDGSKLVVSGSASFYGNLKIVDSAQAAGRYLVSDSNGNTSWYMPVGLGMTISGYTFSVNLQANSGLSVSMSGLAINPNIAGYGLTYSGGSMSFTTNINASQGYIPYYNTTTSLTSSVIYQTSSNILIGTISNNGARLQIAGSVSIISATGNAFQLKDTTQGAGYILNSDVNGFGSWKPYKYSGTQSFTANLSQVIAHNLNTNFYIIQLFDYTTGEEILGAYTTRGLTQATITLSSNVSSCGIVIMG